MPAAVAIPAAVSAGSSILGGLLGSSAASKAAKVQQQAANTAATNLTTQLGIYNPQIGAAADTAAGNVNTATTAGEAGITGAVGTGQAGIGSATTQAQGFLQPYMDAGGQSLSTLMTGLAPGGDLNKTFTAADMEAYDPGYAFRMAQANKAMTGSAAARGGSLGGGTLAAMSGLDQNLASSEFANANARFTQQQTDRFNRLNSLVNLGATTSNEAGQFGMTGANEQANLGLTGANEEANLGLTGATTAGQFETNAANTMATNALNTYGKIGDLMTGGAAAQAGGIVGSANAWGGALQGVGGAANQVGNYYSGQQTMKTLGQYFRNPAVPMGQAGDGYTKYSGNRSFHLTRRPARTDAGAEHPISRRPARAGSLAAQPDDAGAGPATRSADEADPG